MLLWFGGVAKEFRHAPVTAKILSVRAYEKPTWRYESLKPFPVIGACPKFSRYSRSCDLYLCFGICEGPGLRFMQVPVGSQITECIL